MVYLGGVEVDIFGTAVLVAGYSRLVVESLLYVECRQLILKKNNKKKKHNNTSVLSDRVKTRPMIADTATVWTLLYMQIS